MRRKNGRRVKMKSRAGIHRRGQRYGQPRPLARELYRAPEPLCPRCGKEPPAPPVHILGQDVTDGLCGRCRDDRSRVDDFDSSGVKDSKGPMG